MPELSYRKLSDGEALAALDALNSGLAAAWAIEDGLLFKGFGFDSYAQGLAFAAAVGHLAERLNHHPDILIGYQRVRVSVSTHDAGGLTSYDFELARRIEAIA